MRARKPALCASSFDFVDDFQGQAHAKNGRWFFNWSLVFVHFFFPLLWAISTSQRYRSKSRAKSSGQVRPSTRRASFTLFIRSISSLTLNCDFLFFTNCGFIVPPFALSLSAVKFFHRRNWRRANQKESVRRAQRPTAPIAFWALQSHPWKSRGKCTLRNRFRISGNNSRLTLSFIFETGASEAMPVFVVMIGFGVAAFTKTFR